MTPLILTTLHDLTRLSVDSIIDVRAPSEYAEDHLPGAINLPVLTDAQRAEVGTIYTRDSPFNARKIGGALVAQNTARHLQGPLGAHDGSWLPLVYCWRGGQRSGAFATILDQVGWRVQLLKGGYRSYRRLVVEMLYDTPLPHRIRLIDGGTGTAKTRMLQHLQDAGGQVLDLEGLARHRGSLFGGMTNPQPDQKMFESQVAQGLNALDPSRITWIEAESSKIGERLLPPSLWTSMQVAPRLRLEAPIMARARFLTRAYSDLMADPEHLQDRIEQLRPYHAEVQVNDWLAQATSGAWEELAASLIARHYDPRYAKSAARSDVSITPVSLPDLEDDTLRATAERLLNDAPQA
ncbi:tRNA 2-selenouridine(34) synthase MnmH [Sulfitobacter sp. JB4-11]|uniref:tRNA 2-selenouridine(34) synthase MnmH n=1 Tax=Sulfitobacter rhodophyticola TaxID=3238304 RepID=UPI003514934C